MQLPAYHQHIAAAIMRTGKTRSQAIQIAIATVRRWRRGGGHVDANTRAAAAKADAEFEAARARAKATPNKGLSSPRTASVDLAGTFDPAKHPHQPAGQTDGGQWAPEGAAGNANSAEQNAQAKALFGRLANMPPDQRAAFLKGLSPEQLTIMRQLGNSDKGSLDAGSLTALNGELGSRGILAQAMNPKKATKPKAAKKPAKPKASPKPKAPAKAKYTTPKAAPKAKAPPKPSTGKPLVSKPSTTKPATGVKTTASTPKTSPSTTTPAVTPPRIRVRRPHSPRRLYSGRAHSMSRTTEPTNATSPVLPVQSGYPIRSIRDLHKTVTAFGRFPGADRAGHVANIRTQAEALGASNLDWVRSFLASHPS